MAFFKDKYNTRSNNVKSQRFSRKQNKPGKYNTRSNNVKSQLFIMSFPCTSEYNTRSNNVKSQPLHCFAFLDTEYNM